MAPPGRPTVVVRAAPQQLVEVLEVLRGGGWSGAEAWPRLQLCCWQVLMLLASMAHRCCTDVVERTAPPELADVLEVPRGSGGASAEAGQQPQLEPCAAEARAAGTDIARKSEGYARLGAGADASACPCHASAGAATRMEGGAEQVYLKSYLRTEM